MTVVAPAPEFESLTSGQLTRLAMLDRAGCRAFEQWSNGLISDTAYHFVVNACIGEIEEILASQTPEDLPLPKGLPLAS